MPKRLLATVIVIILMAGMLPLSASAATAAELATQISAAGLTAAASGNTVTVIGNVSDRGTTLKLDISAGVTVVWRATFRGTANPVLDLWGSGTVQVEAGAWIQNTSSGNSFTAVRANDSIRVLVEGGIIQSGKGRAIEGAGVATIVTVRGTGAVFNASTNNLFPCIDMTNADNTGRNVIVSGGGEVFSDPDPLGAATVYGYAIQTYGNVLVSGGKVYTTGRNGRCINLVGMNSNASVTGGEVTATGANGVCISTSTTNPGQVTNSSVTVSGGFVASFGIESGWAIRTTGANSTVNVSGGCVFGIGNSAQYSGTSLTSVPAAAINSVIFIQGRSGGYSGPGGGVVIAWDRNSWNSDPHNRAPYNENAVRHIFTSPAQSASSTPPTYALWTKSLNPRDADGISYSFGSNAGFIPLAEVEVRATRTVRIVAGAGGEIVAAYDPDSPLPHKQYLTAPPPWYNCLIEEVPFNSRITFEFAPSSPNIVDYIDIRNSTTNERIRDHPDYEDNEYTLSNIRHDYVVVVYFVKLDANRNSIVSYAGSGGVISDDGLQIVNTGATGITRTITAAVNHHIVDVRVDGVSVLESSALSMSPDRSTATYSFPTIARNSVISVLFEANAHEITASARRGGSISPQGVIPAADGSDHAFTITPNPGYYIDRVLIDGEPWIGARSVYEFLKVDDDHTIEVFFAQNRHTNHTITASANANGRLIPAGINPDDPDQAPIINASRGVLVPDGANQTFRIIPDAGFRIRDVIVNGTSQGAINSYTFDEVRSDHTIRVEFESTQQPGESPPQTGDSIPVLPIFMIALGTLAIMSLLLNRRRLKKDKK